MFCFINKAQYKLHLVWYICRVTYVTGYTEYWIAEESDTMRDLMFVDIERPTTKKVIVDAEVILIIRNNNNQTTTVIYWT